VAMMAMITMRKARYSDNFPYPSAQMLLTNSNKIIEK
jgi:hypothetical protein